MRKSDGRHLLVHPARAIDVEAWFALRDGYCAELEGVVSEMITAGKSGSTFLLRQT
jgi:hypothetical protein